MKIIDKCMHDETIKGLQMQILELDEKYRQIFEVANSRLDTAMSKGFYALRSDLDDLIDNFYRFKSNTRSAMKFIAIVLGIIAMQHFVFTIIPAFGG